MSTPTEAYYDLRRHVIFSDPDDGAELIANSEARAVAAAVTALTCTHHNDLERAACPVCLVTALTAERDQLRAALALGQQNCDDAYDDLRAERDAAIARAERAEADLKLLREWQRDVIQNASAHHAERKDAIARAESAEREAFDWKKIARYEAARAERAEASLHALRLVCGTTDAEKFTTWVDRANARAEKAEAELAFQVARNSDLFTQRDEAVEAQGEAEAELATERARLKEMAAELAHCAGYIASVRTDRLITWHEELYALQTLEWAEGAFEIAEKANAVLEAHDAAMKEGAK